MKNSRFIPSLLFLVFLLLCASCVWSVSKQFLNKEKGNVCSVPPGKFSQTTLIGTWMAKDYMSDATDTLIFREDNKYRQIIHLVNPAVDYESDWQDWRLEYGIKGIPYLYLQGLRICAANPYYDCNWVNDDNVAWSDCCGDRPTKPHIGEITLTVLGPPSYSTPTATMQDFSLLLFRGCESSSWIYRFLEP